MELSGTGGYGTVYTAEYHGKAFPYSILKTVVLKRFKSYDNDKTPELFISEISNL